jgi:hypothetical protein
MWREDEREAGVQVGVAYESKRLGRKVREGRGRRWRRK